MTQQGMVHLIAGEGAGKTTGAFGLALRFSAYGSKVLIIQFLKCKPSGECIAMQAVQGVDVLITGQSVHFVVQMTAEEREAEQHSARKALTLATEKMAEGTYQMIVLDEIGGAIENGFLAESDVLAFLEARPASIELVLTGRSFPGAIAEKADYSTQIHSIKHPYENGIPARRGVEY